ncbi:hypothetical protein [Ferruginibacter sp.]
MNQVPVLISIAFALTTFLAIGFFYRAAHYSKTVLLILLAWIALQSIPALNGFYTINTTVPPRFFLLIGPPLVYTIILFSTQKGRQFIDSLDLGVLTLLHSIRIFVELVLLGLYSYKTVPVLITFEGRNFDILSGLTAPIIYYFGFVKKSLGYKWILAWNFICLALLINVVVHAVLSAPLPFQQFAFDQPNIAVLYFPFVWLPCCLVPLVLFSHLVAIRRLIKQRNN